MKPNRSLSSLLLALLCVLPCAAPAHASTGPNIVVVFIDDMGWSDVSCFGGKDVETENIDRLAKEGIRFTNVYVNSPICSPSRVALTTGHYPQRWKITSYLAHRKANDTRGMAQWLDPQAPVLARELRKAGYRTGHFGKWHMGGQRDVADAPPISAYGFDASLTNFEGMGAKLLPLTLKPGQDPATPGRIWGDAERLGEPVTWMQRSKITAGFVDAALDFIDRAGEDGTPFYLNLWPDDVHSPFWPPVEQWGDGGKRALYYAVLDEMDRQLGVLFDRIRNDDKLRDNTLILFLSDNGHETGAGRSDPLRGAKTWLYEGGIRSPLIVWGPGLLSRAARGITNEASVFSAIDLNRSLYAIAGLVPPAEAALDGENILSALLGTDQATRQAPLIWRRPPDRPGFGHGYQEDNPDFAAREGQWKLLMNFGGSDLQLYDLAADPGETRNLAAGQPAVVARLRKAIETWNATMPADASDPSFGGNEKAKVGVLPGKQFVNPIGEGADPWVVRDPSDGRYLWCLSEGNRAIAVHASDRLTSLGEKHIVWRAPDSGPVSREVWAPELHFLDGRWYIYFAASDGRNENHLAYVLESEGKNPLGPYRLHGPLATGEGTDGRSPNTWAIDMTPLRHNGRLYALWSGWDAPGTDRQFLYLAPMKSPVELAGPRVRLCANDDHPWEFTEDRGNGRGLNEAPQVFRSGKRTFVTYSCGASWLNTYKLGMLELVGDDPMDPKAWTKRPRPIFRGTEETYGVGHSCFVRSPDGSEWWHVFHAKRSPRPGWQRGIHVQPMGTAKGGAPLLGKPAAAGEPLGRPSGERVSSRTLPLEAFSGDSPSLVGWSYYGHHQHFAVAAEGVQLGVIPEHPVNAFRCGEKLVLDALLPDDLSASVNVDFQGVRKTRGAGILVRTSGPALGWDAHRGYYAGLKPDSGHLIFGKMDGAGWKELARKQVEIDLHGVRLGVTCRGKRFVVTVGGRPILEVADSDYPSGTVGLRVVDTHAVFSDLQVCEPD